MMKYSSYILTSLMASPATAQTWGSIAKTEEKARSFWTEPLWPAFWMAWTPATFVLFCGIFGAMGILTTLEIRRPGGDERRGVLGLTTTRGDRLFISLLGTAYIFLAWLGLIGQPLWWPLGLSIAWAVFCFRKV